MHDKHLSLVRNCQHLLPNEVVLASEENAINKYDMSNCKVFSESIVTNPVVIYFRKNHFLLSSFNRIIRIFKEAGIFSFWVKRFRNDFRKNEKVGEKHPRIMTLFDLSGCFKIWMYGLLISSLVFVLEKFLKLLGFIAKVHHQPFQSHNPTTDNDKRRCLSLP